MSLSHEGLIRKMFFRARRAGAFAAGAAAVLLSACPPHPASAGTRAVSAPAPYGPVPSKAQLAWHEIETYCLMHFSMATFTDQEWAYGEKPPPTFNPSDFDADQIVRAAGAAGLKGFIIVAKHHDGFCLWPTETTDYSVKNSTWKNGKGDVVGEIAGACRRHGLAVGIYCSPWDRNNAEFGRPGYVKTYHAQLRELWTRYGPLFEVWFDGAFGGSGYYGGARGVRKIDPKTYYDYQSIFKMLRELQPGAAMFSELGRDIRWCGNEGGAVGDPCWATYTPTYRGTKIPVKYNGKTDFFEDFPNGRSNYKEAAGGKRDGMLWMPAEADFPLRPGWFYHRGQDGRARPPQNLIRTFFLTAGRGGSFNIGIAPDKRGRIHDGDAAALAKFGEWRRETFGTDLAAGAKLTPSNTRGGAAGFAAANLLDNRNDTYWATDDAVLTPSLTVDLGKETEFNVVNIREYLPLGQRIDGWALDLWKDGKWVEFAKGESVGSRRLVRTGRSLAAAKVRLRITKAAACPAIRQFSLHREPEWARTAEKR